MVNDLGTTLDGAGTAQGPAAETCRLIEDAGGKAVPNGDSVADFDGAGRIIAQAVDTFGSIDILVNNAGIVRDRTLVKMTSEDYDAVVAVHQKGTFNCARHAAVHMRDAGYGRIVNITSSAGLRGNFGQSNYGAAKAAIMGMTFVWALELGKYGITVNAVAPAGLTRMTENLFGGAEAPPDQNPALNAPLVAFLASEQAELRERPGARVAPGTRTPSSRRPDRSRPCGATVGGPRARSPSTSTRSSASTSSPWGCPPTPCSARRTATERATRRPRPSARRRSDRLEDDHRDLALGVLLVVVVGGPRLGGPGPPVGALLPGWRCAPGAP